MALTYAIGGRKRGTRSVAWGLEGRERPGDDELATRERELGRRAASGGAGAAVAAGRREEAVAAEDAAEVGGGDRVAEHRLVDVGQLAEGEARRRERERRIRVRQLAPQALVRPRHRRGVAERDLWQLLDRVPLGVGRQLR